MLFRCTCGVKKSSGEQCVLEEPPTNNIAIFLFFILFVEVSIRDTRTGVTISSSIILRTKQMSSSRAAV